jgi:cation diffusion facilitator family transporter
MSAHCHDHACSSSDRPPGPRWRRVLWVALIINAVMFAVEVGAGVRAGSVALLADAVDFFGDAANYGVSLWVLGMAAVWRARAALVKGLTMGAFGLFVLGRAAWAATQSSVPEPMTMGVVGSIALVANVAVALMLYAWRDGDANMRSVWLCSRNDAIGNVAVVAAGLGVFGTASAWPDLAVAAAMGLLALSSAWTVVRQARGELRAARVSTRTAHRHRESDRADDAEHEEHHRAHGGA